MSDITEARQMAYELLSRDHHEDWEHVCRVASHCRPEYKAVAYLHDVVEDGLVGLDDYQLGAFMSDEQLVALDRLDRGSPLNFGATYHKYINNICNAAEHGAPGGLIALRVKSADNRDNLAREAHTDGHRELKKPDGRYDKARDRILWAQDRIFWAQVAVRMQKGTL